MLRPAFLLPPKRLSTPRSGHQDLPQRLGPATGLTGDYPDWTHTSRRNTARRHDPNPNHRNQPLLFTTHHAVQSTPTLGATPRPARAPLRVEAVLDSRHGDGTPAWRATDAHAAVVATAATAALEAA